MLKGNRVYLSPIREKDMPELFSWINDRDSVLWNAPYRPISEMEHCSWYQSLFSKRDHVLFLIRRISDDRAIGSCQLVAIQPVHRNAELRIRIGEKANRGQGHGTEALQLLLKFAFDDLNLKRVYLHVFANNTNAIRLYEKLAFIREGELREAAYIDGKYINLIIMARLRDE